MQTLGNSFSLHILPAQAFNFPSTIVRRYMKRRKAYRRDAGGDTGSLYVLFPTSFSPARSARSRIPSSSASVANCSSHLAPSFPVSIRYATIYRSYLLSVDLFPMLLFLLLTVLCPSLLLRSAVPLGDYPKNCTIVRTR